MSTCESLEWWIGIMGSKYTEAQKKAIYRNQEKHVKIQIQVLPEKREEYKSKAEAEGKSLTRFIIDCIEKGMK